LAISNTIFFAKLGVAYFFGATL